MYLSGKALAYYARIQSPEPGRKTWPMRKIIRREIKAGHFDCTEGENMDTLGIFISKATYKIMIRTKSTLSSNSRRQYTISAIPSKRSNWQF